nr:unnamed protein product [Haemonchus contortus]
MTCDVVKRELQPRQKIRPHRPLSLSAICFFDISLPIKTSYNLTGFYCSMCIMVLKSVHFFLLALSKKCAHGLMVDADDN